MEIGELDRMEKEQKRAAQLRDLAGSPLPTIFKPWMRAMDPTLELEDTNPWFEAFRRRRLYLKNRPLLENFGARMGRRAKEILAALGVILVVASILVFGFLACCLVVFFFLILSFVHEFARKRRLQSGFFPEKLDQAFGKSGFHHQCVHDLWMTGASGRAILQAIYLEGREKHSSFMLMKFLVILGVLLIPFVVYIWQVGPLAVLLNPVILFGLCVAVVLAMELHIWIWLSTMRSIIVDRLSHIVLFWEDKSVAAYSSWRSLLLLAVYIIYGVLFVVVELMIWSLIGYFIIDPSANLVWFLVFLNVGGIVACLRIVRGFYLRSSLDKLDVLLRRADEAFLYFLVTRVLEDPDIQVWNPRSQWMDSPGRNLADGK